MANNLGSTQRGLGNRCTPMLVMGDSREAAVISSDCTPQLVLTTASNVEPTGPEVTGNTSGVRNVKLPKQRKLYTRKKGQGNRNDGTRRKWTKEDYVMAMECKFRAENVGITWGLGRKVHEYWNQKGMFEIEEKILMNQIRAIVSKGWLTQLEMETIKRNVRRGSQNEEVTEIVDMQEEVVDLPEPNISMQEETVLEENHALSIEDELTEEEKNRLDRLRSIITGDNTAKIYDLKYQDRSKLKQEIGMMNNVLRCVQVTDITHLRNVVQAAAIVVGEAMGAKERQQKKEKKEPYWKRRIIGDISRLRKDLSRIEAWFGGRWKRGKKRDKDELDRKYKLKSKGFTLVMEELKQRITAKATKVKRYDNRIKQFQDNRDFRTNQGRFFKRLEGGDERTIQPNAAEATRFWNGIWGTNVSHNSEAEWITRAKESIKCEKQAAISITQEDVKGRLKSIPDWKGAGPDGIQGFWIKYLSAIHGVLARTLNDCIGSGEVPEWMVEGRTVLIMKDPSKGTEVGNYRPIACLNLIWKLMTGILSDKTYSHLDANNVLPDEQKGCRKSCQGTKDQLAIDRCILQNCKRRKTNLSMAWIDYKKAYDMVPHSWIVSTMEMVGLADNIVNLISGSMDKWKTNLYADGKHLGVVPIKRGIFQGDSFSPLLFVIALLPLTHVLREADMGYQMEKNGEKVNHLFFMDDLKLYGNSDNQIDSLVRTVWQCSEDICMEFGISKCAMVSLKRGKKVRCEGIRLPNDDEISEAESQGYKYLGVLEVDKVLCKEMKKKVEETYIRRVSLLIKSKLNGRNLVLALNSWAVAVIRYSAAFINWTKEETRVLDRRTRKLLVQGGAHHMKSNVMKLYVKRKNGGKGLIGVEECWAAEMRNIDYYVANSKEKLLKVVARLERLDREKIEGKEEYKTRMEREKIETIEGMELHGQFERQTKGEKTAESWNWLKYGNLKRETESLLLAAQEQALNTNSVKKIYDRDVSNKCRLCGTHVENVMHIVSGV